MEIGSVDELSVNRSDAARYSQPFPKSDGCGPLCTARLVWSKSCKSAIAEVARPVGFWASCEMHVGLSPCRFQVPSQSRSKIGHALGVQQSVESQLRHADDPMPCLASGRD